MEWLNGLRELLIYLSGVRAPEGALKGSDFADLGMWGWDFFYCLIASGSLVLKLQTADKKKF